MVLRIISNRRAGSLCVHQPHPTFHPLDTPACNVWRHLRHHREKREWHLIAAERDGDDHFVQDGGEREADEARGSFVRRDVAQAGEVAVAHDPVVHWDVPEPPVLLYARVRGKGGVRARRVLTYTS